MATIFFSFLIHSIRTILPALSFTFVRLLLLFSYLSVKNKWTFEDGSVEVLLTDVHHYYGPKRQRHQSRLKFFTNH